MDYYSSSMPFDRRKVAEELLRGREFAKQLRLLLTRSVGDDVAIANLSGSEDLVSRILNSFSKSISMLNRYDSDDVNGSTVNSPSSWDARKSEESGESCKSSTFKDRRGCYKRRKTAHSWTKESSTLIDDGYAWRKYGQKVILNAKFPRNYFRCTHKFDQGCQATKQVQRVEEDPPKYCTTYYGHHSCTNFLKASEIVLDSNFEDSCGVLLSFDNKTSTVHQQINHQSQQDEIFASFPSSACTVMKEFIEEEEERIGVGRDVVQNSSSNYIMSPEDLTVVSSLPVLSSSLDQSEYGGEMDVLSEVMMGSVVDFDDDVLQFDF